MRIAIILAALLAGCAHNAPRFETASGLIQWHKVQTLNDIQSICNPRGGITGIVYGCYRMGDDNKICHVYAIDNEKYYYVIGHEVKHCFDGRFHNQSGDINYPIDKQGV